MIFNVLGGHDGRQSLRSTELITINPPSTRYGPTLPKGLYGHCSVIIGDKIFVTIEILLLLMKMLGKSRGDKPYKRPNFKSDAIRRIYFY